MSQELINALEGCLNPNTVQLSELKLQQLSEHSDFTEQLLRLIGGLESSPLLIMVLSTLKNFITERYNSKEGRIIDSQKDILKGSLFDMFYAIKNNPNAVNLYKEIIFCVIAVDFPWNGVDQQLLSDLDGRIEAGVYFCRQVARNFQYLVGENRLPMQSFTLNIFPKLEGIAEQVLTSFNEQTCRLLEEILECFYSAFHVSIPEYLRNFDKIDRWMVFFNCVLGAPTSDISLNSQILISRIYIKFFALYSNEAQDGKQFPGWSLQFKKRYACKLFDQIYQLIVQRKGNEEIMANMVNCLHQIVKKEDLRALVTSDHIQNLFYGNTLLPLCQSSKQELRMFHSEQIQYIRRQEDLSCYELRRAILDFIQISCNYLVFNQKSELMSMVEYCAKIITNGNSGGNEKQVAIRILSKIGVVLLKQRFFRKEFQNLVITYFQPMLLIEDKLLNSLMCGLLAEYLPFGDLSSQTVSALMEQIYSKIINENSLVIRYNSILAFTALLGHKSALDAAKNHFSNILQIYVKTLNELDHENLLGCLQSIVKHFESQIVSFAPDLLSHLMKMFCSLAKKDENDPDSQDDEPDCNTPASATLSTIKQIINCKLPPQLYVDCSVELIELLRGITGYYSEFFDQILSLFAVLCYNAPGIADFQYPYAVCRQLLEGDVFNLSGSKLSRELLEEISKMVKADFDHEDNLVAILKNIIQKAPDHVLRSYPWPRHQQLILALIENKRISPQELSTFDTSQVTPSWSAYLSAYSLVVFNVGQLCPPENLSRIVGVSLFPWLQEGISVPLVKLITNSIEDEEDDDDLLQQNTALMLQRYANEDEDESEEYQESSGINYTYLYNSPFDAGKDRDMLIAHVKGLSEQTAFDLANSLSGEYRKKLEILMSQQNQ